MQDTRTILIRYEDADGIYDLDPIDIAIHKVIPTVDLSQSDTGTSEGSSYTLTLLPDDPGHNPIVSWFINWNTANTSEPDTQTIYGNPSTVQHFYATHGTYTISATATDSRGSTSSDTAALANWEIEVADVAPTLTATGPATFPEHGVYRLNLSAVDPGGDIFNWLINWNTADENSVAESVSSTAAFADHTYGDTGGPFDITIDTGGWEAGTVAPPDPIHKSVGRGAEQTQLYNVSVSGGTSNGDTVNAALSHIRFDSKFSDSTDDFSGHSNLDYVPIISRSDATILQSAKDAIAGQVVVDRYGSDGKDSFTEHDHIYSWPADFTFTMTSAHNADANYDTYTITYTLDVPYESWSVGDISWHKQAHVTGSVVLNPVQMAQYFNGTWATEGTPAAFSLGLTGGNALDVPFTVKYKVGGDAVCGEDGDYTFEAGEGLTVVGPDDDGFLDVTFAAQVNGRSLYVVPTQDSLPQWTRTVTLAVADPRVLVYPLDANPAVMQIVDDDRVNIEINGVSEDDETNCGAEVIVNDDDDDGNKIPDWQEMGYVAGENNLYPVTITCPDTGVSDTDVKLCAGPYDEGFRLWDTQDKSGQMVLGDLPGGGVKREWHLPAGVTSMTLWLEARGLASLRWLTLTLATTDVPGAPNRIRQDQANAAEKKLFRSARVYSVEYSATDPDMFNTILPDAAETWDYGKQKMVPNPADPTTFASPQWLWSPMDDYGDDYGLASFLHIEKHAYPIAYTRSGINGVNVIPKLTVKLRVNGPSDGQYVVRGSATVGGFSFTLGPASATYNKGFITATVQSGGEDQECIPPWIDKTDLKVTWYVSCDDVANERQAGDTSNLTYISNVDLTQPVLQTVLDIGCRNCQGEHLTDFTAVRDAIWSDFSLLPPLNPASAKGVRRADGNIMAYWRRWDADDYATLVKKKEGRCQGWAQLLVAVWACQGVQSRMYQFLPETGFEGFMVKKNDAQGHPATDNLKRDFNTHFVVMQPAGSDAEKIWDPSYGMVYKSQIAWEDGSLLYQELQMKNKIKINTPNEEDLDLQPCCWSYTP